MTAFQPGKADDLNNFNVEAEEKAKTPWYIKYTVKNNGPVDANAASISTSVVAFDSDGKPLRETILIGSFPQCEGTLSDGPFPSGTTKENVRSSPGARRQDRGGGALHRHHRALRPIANYLEN